MAEIPKGYMQTEVGVIPEDWEVKTFESLAHIERGKFTARPRNDPKYFGGEFPFIQTGDVTNSNGQITSFSQTLNREGLKVSKLFPQGTLFFTIAANIGDIGLAAFDTACPDSLVAITPRNKIDKRWLAHELRRRKSSFENLATHNAQLNINLEKLRPYLLPVPTKAEQEAIAEALGDADALIESLEQLIAKKRLLKQGAMQELLTGKKRLPGFRGEWKVKRLGELADIRSGGTPSTTQPQFWDGEILWCTPTDITALNGHKYLTDTSRRITQHGLKNSSAEIIPAKSIVMTSRATIGECAINTVAVSTNQGFKNFIPFEAVDVEFLYYMLLTQKQGFISLCGGSTFLEIGKNQLSVFEIRLPATKAEQTAIAAILSDMDAEIAALEAKLAKARSIKQGMMQELLTGRIRLVRPAAKVIPFPVKKKAAPAAPKPHSWQINEAVIIAVLAKNFGSEKFPLARVRCTKLTYLLHRHVEGQAEGYLKKAAGPYNPGTRYKGPEGIAQKKSYARLHHNGKYEGFVAANNIDEAEAYFGKWYGQEVLTWLEQLRYRKTDDLELLATVDMAMEELGREGKSVVLGTVKQVIHDHPEWVAKLERQIFSDANITRAITECQMLFGN